MSRSADYGLRALIYLAQHGRERPVPLQEISAAQHIPPALLSKILQALVKAEVLRSHRGHGGGFVLVREPASLTLDAIIQTIDGPFVVFECLEDPSFCQLCHLCKLRGKLGELQGAIRGMLAGVSVADCLPEAEAEALPRALPSAS